MSVEIEHKFLVRDKGYKILAYERHSIRQYYIARGDCLVRVRIVDNTQANLTLKGGKVGTFGIQEWEYPIPLEDAESMVSNTKGSITKVRWRVHYKGKDWEVDEFLGANSGLVVAELEVDSETEDFALPPWLGERVTKDKRYSNINLLNTPYNTWGWEAK